jgi:DNA-binding transcriptional LysR family regulator
MIDVRRLRYFVAVAESLHFGRAAASLRISQPPLTRQIQLLEHEIGTLLLRRNKRRVELTDAGQYLLDEARRMLAEGARLAERTRRAAAGDTGHLTLGFISAVDYSVLPGILIAYRKAFPGVTLDLRELTTDVQLDMLRDGRIDAGMLLQPVDDVTLVTLPIISERLVAVLPARDPLLRRRGPLSLHALATRPFIVAPRANGPGLHDTIFDFCAHAGFVPLVAQEAIQLQTIVSLVSAGLGIALVPASLKDLRRSGVVYRSLREPSPLLTVMLAWRRDNHSACLANFVAIARAKRARKPRAATRVAVS